MDTPREAHILERVAERLSASAQHIFSASGLLQFLDNLRAEGILPKSPSSHKLQQLVIATGIVHEIELTATYPFDSKRYHRGPFSPLITQVLASRNLEKRLVPRKKEVFRRSRLPVDTY
jgi:hypothetical protein